MFSDFIRMFMSDKENCFKEVVENFPLAVFLTDEHLQCSFKNKKADELLIRLFQLNEIEPGLSSLLENFADKATNLEIYQVYNEELDLTDRFGKNIILEMELFKEKNDCCIFYFADSTLKKNTENSLTLLATGIEHADESIMISSKEGMIKYVNPAFEKITGYSREEALNQRASLYNGHFDTNEEYHLYVQTLKEGKNWKGILKNKRKDGTEYMVENTISPITDNNNQIINFVAISRDVTQNIKMENQIKQMLKMEAIGQLAGGIAHDLNNVLTPILGYIDMYLLDSDENTDFYSDLQEMKKASMKAKSMVQQLLAFSRKQILKMDMVSMIDIVRDIEKILRRLIREDIEIQIKYPAFIRCIKADVTQIQQILINLCVNAQDAMLNGGLIDLEIGEVFLDEEVQRLHNEIVVGDYVYLYLSDNGSGIEKEILNHIFEPFFTTKPQGKGTGLGLSTVFGIVKQHNGYVYVYSEVGIGTSFKIYFPVCDKEYKECNPIENHQGTFKNMKIILAEDDESIRKFVMKTLLNKGYDVTETKTSSECLKLITHPSSDYDLLLTDVIMPQVSGVELYQQAKMVHPNLQVIFMSGYEESLVKNNTDNQELLFLAKPFTVEQLYETINRIIPLE